MWLRLKTGHLFWHSIHIYMTLFLIGPHYSVYKCMCMCMVGLIIYHYCYLSEHKINLLYIISGKWIGNNWCQPVIIIWFIKYEGWYLQNSKFTLVIVGYILVTASCHYTFHLIVLRAVRRDTPEGRFPGSYLTLCH